MLTTQKNQSIYAITIFAALLLIFSFAAYEIWKTAKGPTSGGDFSLTYRNQPWTFSAQPKKLNLLYFGYTKCPDICPLSLSNAGNAFKKLDVEDLERVRFIFVSVDQKHDDPNNVADYATNFFASFIGLSGSQEQIDNAIKLFPASYMYEENPKSYLGYSISHTDRIFFLDRKGQMMDSISGSKDGADAIYKKIKENL